MARFVQCHLPAGSLKVRIADRFWTRALGLLVGTPLATNEGLLISPCSSIHTIGMRYPIDVVFVDKQARVVRVCENVEAGRARFKSGARAVVEMRAGVAAMKGLVAGVVFSELATEL